MLLGLIAGPIIILMEEHFHRFSSIKGKCVVRKIVGMENGLTPYRFNNIYGKNNPQTPRFYNFNKKSDYCHIWGKFIRHRFNKVNGKCDYCHILGCSNGFIKHRFNRISGKCKYCRVLKSTTKI